jgi:hypothetical protein
METLPNANFRKIVLTIRNFILIIITFPVIMILLAFFLSPNFVIDTLPSVIRNNYWYIFNYVLGFSIFMSVILHVAWFLPDINLPEKIYNRSIKSINILTRHKLLILFRAIAILGLTISGIFFLEYFNTTTYSYFLVSLIVSYLFLFLTYIIMSDYEICRINLERYIISKDKDYLQMALIKLNKIYYNSFSIIAIYQLVWIVEKANNIKDDDKFNTNIEQIISILKEEKIDESWLSDTLDKLFIESKRYNSKMLGILDEPKLPLRVKIQSNLSNITIDVIKGVGIIILIAIIYFVFEKYLGIKLPLVG